MNGYLCRLCVLDNVERKAAPSAHPAMILDKATGRVKLYMLCNSDFSELRNLEFYNHSSVHWFDDSVKDWDYLGQGLWKVVEIGGAA